MNNQTIMARILALLLRAPADEGTAGGGQSQAGGADSQAGGGSDSQAGGADTQPGGNESPKWYKSDELSQDEQQWLAARGLAEDDPLKAIPKMVKGHRMAEQRIGKGLDNILDRPGKDEAYGDWARKNAVALGLPEKEEGYTVQKPEFWPKDAAWNVELEGQARAIAFKHGLPPAAFQDLVTLQAKSMKDMLDAADVGLAQAQTAMMAELNRDFGAQTDAVITRSKQGLQFLGEQAGLSSEALNAAVQSLADKMGDASVIRLFAKVAELSGDDSMVRSNGGNMGFGTTPAEARAEAAKLTAPGGAYYEAVASGNLPVMNELKPRLTQLNKIAGGGKA